MELSRLIQILKAESQAGQAFLRQPESESIMSNTEQAQEYNDGANLTGPLLPIYFFHLPRIGRLIKSGDSVLDLGCGTAQMLCMLAPLFQSVQFTGLDLSEKMLAQAKVNQARVEKNRGHKLTNLQFKTGSMLELAEFEKTLLGYPYTTGAQCT